MATLPHDICRPDFSSVALVTFNTWLCATDQQLLDALNRMPFVESTELVLILGEPPAAVHRALPELLADSKGAPELLQSAIPTADPG